MECSILEGTELWKGDGLGRPAMAFSQRVAGLRQRPQTAVQPTQLVRNCAAGLEWGTLCQQLKAINFRPGPSRLSHHLSWAATVRN